MDEGYSVETNIYEHGIATGGKDLSGPLRLIATTKLPIYSGFNLAIVDFKGNSLNERAVHLANVNGPHWVADYYEEDDLLFERTYPVGKANRGNVGDPRVFYEIDAFMGAARRVYSLFARCCGNTIRVVERQVDGAPFEVFWRHPVMSLYRSWPTWRRTGDQLVRS